MTNWQFHFLGYPIHIHKPWMLLGLLLVMALTWWSLSNTWRRIPKASTLVAPHLLETLVPGISKTQPLYKTLLSFLGLSFFVIALCQPQCGSQTEIVKRRGVDIVLAMDVSKSMLTKDILPSRLERAKLEFFHLIDKLKGDRVAIVAFSSSAFVQCPLTSDYGAAQLFLNNIHVDTFPPGPTNVGAALKLSAKLLNDAGTGSKSRVVVLLSDGEDLLNEVESGIETLKAANVQVLAVGIGSEIGEPIPKYNAEGNIAGYMKDAQNKTVISRLDKQLLKNIANATQGEFFYEPNGVAANLVGARIDSMQKEEFESRVSTRYAEIFQPFVALGILSLLAGMLLPPSKRKAQ
ncbi:MAG: VWA domain-containing protein [Proteobacteria bacterium]|nr:VWA domain-containing protein [Cystobacterineae bacterium]MCL2313911.1 VWA domain-containing protein [Pseudomonadota bacterium]